MKKVIAIAVLAAMPIGAVAQDELYVETMEVNVISLDVFVTDKKGNPVTGLTADDFVIYENGRPQDISNFSEIRETPQLLNVPTISPRPMERIPEERTRKVIFFIDNETVHPFNRNKVFEEIRSFTGELLRPGDQAMLVSWNNGLRIEVPFTSLVSEFEATLMRVAEENTMKSARILRRRQAEQSVRGELEMARDPQTGISLRDAYENSLSIGRAYAEETRNELHAKSVALTGLMSTLAGVEGKKAFIYVGEELPLQPGLEIFNYVNEQFSQVLLQQQGQRSSVTLLSPEIQAPTETLVLDAIGRAANANGVTIYMMNAGGGANLSDSPAERNDPRSIHAEFIDTMNRMSSFQTVAAKTGGLAFVQTEDIESAFEKIERDFGTYYSIGYHASPEAQLGEKNLRVKVKNDDYEVRTRKTFYTKSTHDQVIDGVVANLFYETSHGDLPIRVETNAPTKVRGGQYKVTMRVMIPTEALTMIPIGEKLAGKFSVFLGVGDGKGGISQINSQEQPVQVPLDDMKKMAGKHFTFETDLIMRKGENILAVAVLDNVSNLRGFSRTNVDVR